MWVSIFSLLFLAACSKSEVKEWVKVDLSYEVFDSNTQELIISWEKEGVELNYSWSALYQTLDGAKVGESRTEVLLDPFNEHDPDLSFKQTALVLSEMWVPVEKWSEVNLSDKTAVVTNVISEDGIEQVELDANPKYTINPYIWTFTVNSIN